MPAKKPHGIIPPLTTPFTIGSGDAFVAGLLYGTFNGGLSQGLRYASAMAALKLTIPENTPLINKDDVEAIVRGEPCALLR